LSLSLRDEHSLRVFQNGVLRRIFGPKRDEVTEGWRSELHNVYSSPSIIRIIRMGGNVSRMGIRGTRLYVIGRKARGKETTRKTKTCGWIILRWILER
jgi:hypothetical protein